MPPNSIIDRLLVDDDVRDVRCADLEAELAAVGYKQIGVSGSGRCWKHAESADFLDLRDNGPKPMWGSYIKKAAKNLRIVKAKGGF